MGEMNTMWQQASQEMYQHSQAEPQPGPEPGNNTGKPGNNEVTDVDFEEVKGK
jgi:molecular chaperone DnaK